METQVFRKYLFTLHEALTNISISLMPCYSSGKSVLRSHFLCLLCLKIKRLSSSYFRMLSFNLRVWKSITNQMHKPTVCKMHKPLLCKTRIIIFFHLNPLKKECLKLKNEVWLMSIVSLKALRRMRHWHWMSNVSIMSLHYWLIY